MENSFDFPKQMVYGGKHMNHLKFDDNKYDFVSLVKEVFQVSDLSQLHDIQQQHYVLFTEFGKDSNTEFHSYFYKVLNSEKGEGMKNLFSDFVKEVILPYLGLKEALVQKFPTFRVQLPDNVAVAKNHFDHELGHPIGEVNFIIGLTKMWDSNTIWIEKMPRSKEFVQMELNPNSCISFNGNLCEHYNQVNITGQTRVSMDFRVLPLNYFHPEEVTSSVSTKQKFVEGGYYQRVSIQ